MGGSCSRASRTCLCLQASFGSFQIPISIFSELFTILSNSSLRREKYIVKLSTASREYSEPTWFRACGVRGSGPNRLICLIGPEMAPTFARERFLRFVSPSTNLVHSQLLSCPPLVLAIRYFGLYQGIVLEINRDDFHSILYLPFKSTAYLGFETRAASSRRRPAPASPHKM